MFKNNAERIISDIQNHSIRIDAPSSSYLGKRPMEHLNFIPGGQS
ncbi:Uncharacterised protein [Mycobacteroides abscessus subsp. abscessus]|nr:Uncharacterised protein [Mycobacteroides abscessus subsp. abscessus]